MNDLSMNDLTNELKHINALLNQKLTLKQRGILEGIYTFENISKVSKDQKILQLAYRLDKIREELYKGNNDSNINSNVIKVNFSNKSNNAMHDSCQVIHVDFKTKQITSSVTLHNFKRVGVKNDN